MNPFPDGSLTIESSFFEGLSLTAGDSLDFVFTFNTEDEATFVDKREELVVVHKADDGTETATRAEVSTIIQRFIELVTK